MCRQADGTARPVQGWIDMIKPVPAIKPLVFVDVSQPGIARKKHINGWAYFDAKGTRIRDRDEIDRLNAVGLPPAYTNLR